MYCGFSPAQFDEFSWEDVEVLMTAFPYLQNPPIEVTDGD